LQVQAVVDHCATRRNTSGWLMSWALPTAAFGISVTFRMRKPEICSPLRILALMTYSAKFHSASGVLNAAVSCGKPVLASSGEGPLKSVVREYSLGVFIPPDDDAAILDGARRLITGPGQPDWDRYERENSWEENARRVMEAMAKN
jgi:hypothetical protein